MDEAMIDLHLSLPTVLQRSHWLSFNVGPDVPETLAFDSELRQLLTKEDASFLVATKA
jgi:hypothetical protein